MIIKNCNVPKLHTELNSVGLYPFPVETLENGDGDFTFLDGTDMTLVQQIIAEHDPTPIPEQPTKEEMMNDYIADMDFRLLMIELGF